MFNFANKKIVNDMERRNEMKLSTRLLVLLALMGMGVIVASVVGALLPMMGQGMLAMLTAQDIFAFIAPAIAAMAIFYRRPLHVMCLDRAPGWPSLVLSFRYRL